MLTAHFTLLVDLSFVKHKHPNGVFDIIAHSYQKMTQVTLWSRSPLKNVIIWKFAFDTELFEVLMLLGQLAIWFILLDTRLDSLRKYTTVWPYQSFAQSG